MKKRLMILLLGIFMINIVIGTSSNTQSNFTISGCNFEETGLTNGSCSPGGYFSCSHENGNYVLYDTLKDNRGCSLGATTYTPNSKFCCPDGYFCNNTAGPLCNLRLENCFDQDNEDDCLAIGCYWLFGVCTEVPSEYSCSIYENSDDCNEDVWELGQIGIGTEICGTNFTADNTKYIVPRKSCRCKWDNSTCELAFDILEEIHNGTTNSFECLKSFDIGDCINGTQLIWWNATPQITEGYSLGVPISILEAAKCIDNTEGGERACGIPTLKLFGFGLLSFLMSLGIISLFYLLDELKIQKKIKKHL
ncbi:hypothetical protein KAI32_00275 [Candidatus Pacearchaeota archaeon]|nr:hypothetical protein [Candidatus Pacearchaeota archaeon]